MTMVNVPNVGQYGVVKDLSNLEDQVPINAWTDCLNIRFLDGSALQAYGYSQVYGTPPAAPQYLMALTIIANRYWLQFSASKVYATTITGGAIVITDITHATPHAGVVNQWTGTNFQGIPIANVGDTSKVPMYWDMNLAHKFVDLTNWPAATFCKSLRTFGNQLIAIGIYEGGVWHPVRVRFSDLADPGVLPSWDISDPTLDAGDFEIGEGSDQAIDGLQLKDTFIVYKERSAYRLDFVGGVTVISSHKIFGMSGILNRNCMADGDGWHFVVTNDDIVIHDGYTTTSVLDKKARRYFFQNVDSTYFGSTFVFRNQFLNEIYVCYPSIGAVNCDRALVYNYVDKTVSFREMPNLNHAAEGAIDNTLSGSWAGDPAPWGSDLTTWGGPDYTPNSVRVLMASATTNLFLLDGSASYNGSLPNAFLTRQGLSFDADEMMKVIRNVRPKISGNVGETVIVEVGIADDEEADPVWTTTTYTIGSTVECPFMLEGQWISIRFRTGTAYQWRLTSYKWDIEISGESFEVNG